MKRYVAAILALCCAWCMPGAFGEDLKLGMIGLDTSHVVAFAKLLNDAQDPQHIAGARVVAAFKGGSPDVEISAQRVDEYTQKLEKDFGVKIVDS